MVAVEIRGCLGALPAAVVVVAVSIHGGCLGALPAAVNLAAAVAAVDLEAVDLERDVGLS